MSKIAVLVASTLLIGLVGCSNDPEPPAASTPSAASTSAVPSTEPGPPSARASTAGDTEACLQGDFTLTRFVGKGASNSYGTGTGGDIRVSFDKGKYRLTGAGKDPVTLTIETQSGELLVDGRVTGTYRLKGDKATFKVEDSAGKATIEANGNTRSFTMEQVGNVLAPQGSADLKCSESAATIAMPTVRLEFKRI